MWALLPPAPLTHIIKGKDLPPSPPSIGRHQSKGSIIISIIRLTLSSARPLLSSTSHSSAACFFFFFFPKRHFVPSDWNLFSGPSSPSVWLVHAKGATIRRISGTKLRPPDPPAGRCRHSPRLVDSEQPCAIWMWPRCGLQMRWWWIVAFALWGLKSAELTWWIMRWCVSVLCCPGT